MTSKTELFRETTDDEIRFEDTVALFVEELDSLIKGFKNLDIDYKWSIDAGYSNGHITIQRRRTND